MCFCSFRLYHQECDGKQEKNDPGKSKKIIYKIPVVRGVFAFADSMISGYKYLMKSADKAMTEEQKEEDMSKLDKWISDHFGPKMMAVVTGISLVLGVALAFGLFFYLPTFLVDVVDKYLRNPDFATLHPLFEGLMRMIIFVAYIWIVSKVPDIKRVFMYHGAEHKSIFCYESGLPLTVENVKKQKRFHPRCGTSFIFVILIISILISSALVVAFPALSADENRILWMAIKILIVPLTVGIGYEFIKYAGKHDNIFVKILAAPGLWMQRLTTNEPTDDIIEVGIESLKAVLDDVKSDNSEETVDSEDKNN